MEVIRDHAPNLPRTNAYGSELSQVQTHLIDNVVDAVSGGAGKGHV